TTTRRKMLAFLGLEELEPRCVLTGPATTWVPIGSAGQLDTEAMFLTAPGQLLSGRVSALALGQYQGQQALYAGTAGGGIWHTTISSTGPPVPKNQTFTVDPATGIGAGVLSIGTLAVSPFDPGRIYAGTGEANYASAQDFRYGSGVLRSINAGASWTLT